MTMPAAPGTKRRLARGLAASPGRATGRIAFRAEDAKALAAKGEPAVLVRIETSAEDVEGMRAAVAIVTTRGGLTGDAAIVARILGKPCVAGCSSVHVDYSEQKMTVWVEEEHRITRDGVVLMAGDLLTVDGTAGTISEG